MRKNTRILILVLAFLIALGALVFWICRIYGEASFDDMMGKGTKHWKEKKNTRDSEDLAFYRNLYDKGRRSLSQPSQQTKIPKLIHFIWVGPKPFPEESKVNVRSWMTLNPGWTIYFWTDRNRECPVPGMELKLLQDFHFTSLEEEFHKSTNYGEKSDIWRFEILSQMGGLYLDHDVIGFQSLNALHEHFDFYVPLERPHSTAGMDQRIVPAICVIASKPGHPILQKAMLLVKSNWEAVDREFADQPNLKVVHHTFKSFVHAVNQHLGEPDDFVLPAASFFAQDLFSLDKIKKWQKKGYILGQHDWAGKWLDYDKKALAQKQEAKLKNEIKSKLDKVSRKIRFAKTTNLMLLAGNFILLLVFFIRRRRTYP